MIGSGSGVEIGLLLAIAGILVGALLQISASITKLAFREGRTEEKILHLIERLNDLNSDMKDLRESHQRVFSYMMKWGDFKNSLEKKTKE